MTAQFYAKEIRSGILRLLSMRQPGATICPSEAARDLQRTIDAGGAPGQSNHGGNWRDLMQPVRTVAQQMANDGLIDITQKGQAVDPQDFKGPIRLRKRRELPQ